jgi:hypothetical protein
METSSELRSVTRREPQSHTARAHFQYTQSGLKWGQDFILPPGFCPAF